MSESGLDGADPVLGQLLMRTSSVAEAERRGARLLSVHRVLPDVSGDFDARIQGCSLGSVALYQLNYGTAVTVTGPPPDDFVAVALPLHGALRVGPSRSAFEISAARSAAVIASNMPMVLKWSPDLTLLCLRVDFSAFASLARCLDPGNDAPKVSFSPFVHSRAVVDGILSWARLVQLTTDRLGNGRLPPALAARLREQVMMTLLLGQPNSHRDTLTTRPDTVSNAAVRRAMELAEAEPIRYLTPLRLAGAAGVSVRALQVGFRKVLGTTPHEYLTTLRLRRAREELVCAHPDDGATVTDTARRWAFGNVGQVRRPVLQDVRGEAIADPSSRLNPQLSITRTDGVQFESCPQP